MTETLSPQLLEVLRIRYTLPVLSDWRRASSGMVHSTWILTLAGNTKAVVRQYHPSFGDAAIRYEHSILGHLAGGGFPVPRVIPTTEGMSFVRIDGGWFAVFEYCEGAPRTWPMAWKFQPGLITSAGSLLARYHRLMDGFIPDGQHRTRPDGRWLAAEFERLRQTMRAAKTLTQLDRYLLNEVDRITATLVASNQSLETTQNHHPQTIIHGDFGPQNLLVRRGRITAVLDLSNAHRNVRAADIGNSLVKFARTSGPWLDLGLTRMFLRAYQSANALDKEELASLPEWMIRWRLIILYYALQRYYDRGRLEYVLRAVWNVHLLRWLHAHQADLRAAVRRI